MEIIKKSLKSYQDEYLKSIKLFRFFMIGAIVLGVTSIFFPIFLGPVIIYVCIVVVYRIKIFELNFFAATFYVNDLGVLEKRKK